MTINEIVFVNMLENQVFYNYRMERTVVTGVVLLYTKDDGSISNPVQNSSVVSLKSTQIQNL